MDVLTGPDQPAKANDATTIDVDVAVSNGIALTGKASMQLKPADGDMQGFCTATPVPAMPTARIGPLRSSWTLSRSPYPNAPAEQQAAQTTSLLQPFFSHLQQFAHMAAVRPLNDPVYYGPAFLQASLALLLAVVLVPLGLAVQLRTAGYTKTDPSSSPWAGALYIAAAVPLLRLLMQPVACGLFRLGEVLILCWPVFSKIPPFDQVMKLHRFSWLLVSLALLAWHSLVFKVVLQQPALQWAGPIGVHICAAHAAAEVKYACTYQLVHSYSLKVLCCMLLACTASCISALAGIWLLCHALAAHELPGWSTAHPLLLQDLCLTVLSSDNAAASKAVHQLQMLFGLWQPSRTLFGHRHTVPSHQQQNMQPRHAQQVLAMQKQAGMCDHMRQAASSSFKAAVGCTALAAAASLAACGLAITGVTATANSQPHVAVAAAVAVPAWAAAAAGAFIALVGMFTDVGLPAVAALACCCSAAVVACAASVVAAVASTHSAAEQRVPVILAAVAGFSLLVTIAAGLLRLSAVANADNTGQSCKQHHSRLVQAATWSMLSRIMRWCSAMCGSDTDNAYSCGCNNSRFVHCSSTWLGVTQSWQAEGSMLWRQLVEKMFPSREPVEVESVCRADVRLLLRRLGLGDAATDVAISLFHFDTDGIVTEAGMQALVTSTRSRQLGLAETLHNKTQVLIRVEIIPHLMTHALFAVLYLAVFDVGTQMWTGTAVALALVLLGCIWLQAGDTRQCLGNAAWLLSTHAFSVGDTISYKSKDWCVLHINLHYTTLECLTTGVPHMIPNAELRTACSLANKSRCVAVTAAVTVSIGGMPAAKFGAFMEALHAAAAEKAARDATLYVAGSVAVSIAGDKLAFTGAANSMEAQLLINWRSACPASDINRVSKAKADMLQVVHEQYSTFMQPHDSTRPLPEVSMWRNPVYN